MALGQSTTHKRPQNRCQFYVTAHQPTLSSLYIEAVTAWTTGPRRFSKVSAPAEVLWTGMKSAVVPVIAALPQTDTWYWHWALLLVLELPLDPSSSLQKPYYQFVGLVHKTISTFSFSRVNQTGLYIALKKFLLEKKEPSTSWQITTQPCRLSFISVIICIDLSFQWFHKKKCLGRVCHSIPAKAALLETC